MISVVAPVTVIAISFVTGIMSLGRSSSKTKNVPDPLERQPDTRISSTRTNADGARKTYIPYNEKQGANPIPV